VSAPNVSVIVPVYNAEPYLREAVRSLLDEKIPDLEVVIVDDGSTDASLETIRDLPVRVEYTGGRRGVAAARNVGLRASRGEIICFLDADDKLAPGGLRWRIEALATHPSWSAVAGIPAAVIDEGGNVIADARHLLTPGYQCPDRIDLAYFKQGGIFPVLLWLYAFRRSVLETVGFFDEKLKIAEDCEYLFRLLDQISIPVIQKPTVFRRWHDGNVSLQQIEEGAHIRRELTPDTKRAVTAIAAKYGMSVGEEFHLWEFGFLPTPKG